jgi:hypothetical protein
MTRGPVYAPAKVLGEAKSRLGGSVPVAKILLPQFSSALPIRLMTNGTGSRRVAEARPRRPT